MRKFKASICAVIGMSLLCSQLAFSVEPPVAILGDVVGKGSTEMKTAFDKWISISDKAYPLIDGAHLRSGDGMMSSIFRDGARMEIGKKSEIIVTGTRGNYSVDLSKGKIAFSLPSGVSFTVMTPTATIQTEIQPNMIRKVSTANSHDYVRGSVGYDGKGTMVTVLSGTLMTKDTKGAAAHTVTAGNSIYIGGTESGRRATPAQLAQVVREDAETNPQTSSDDEDRRRRAGFFWLGGAALVEGGTYLLVKSQSKSKGGVASPSSP